MLRTEKAEGRTEKVEGRGERKQGAEFIYILAVAFVPLHPLALLLLLPVACCCGCRWALRNVAKWMRNGNPKQMATTTESTWTALFAFPYSLPHLPFLSFFLLFAWFTIIVIDSWENNNNDKHRVENVLKSSSCRCVSANTSQGGTGCSPQGVGINRSKWLSIARKKA